MTVYKFLSWSCAPIFVSLITPPAGPCSQMMLTLSLPWLRSPTFVFVSLESEHHHPRVFIQSSILDRAAQIKKDPVNKEFVVWWHLRPQIWTKLRRNKSLTLNRKCTLLWARKREADILTRECFSNQQCETINFVRGGDMDIFFWNTEWESKKLKTWVFFPT